MGLSLCLLLFSSHWVVHLNLRRYKNGRGKERTNIREEEGPMNTVHLINALFDDGFTSCLDTGCTCRQQHHLTCIACCLNPRLLKRVKRTRNHVFVSCCYSESVNWESRFDSNTESSYVSLNQNLWRRLRHAFSGTDLCMTPWKERLSKNSNIFRSQELRDSNDDQKSASSSTWNIQDYLSDGTS